MTCFLCGRENGKQDLYACDNILASVCEDCGDFILTLPDLNGEDDIDNLTRCIKKLTEKI